MMKKSLREIIYEHIKDDITFGRLVPGERLVESKLAEQFNASRSPIREAIRQLSSEGFITVERNKGISVSRLSIREVEEIYDLRSLIESYATRLTVERITKQQIAYLEGLIKLLYKDAKKIDYINWLKDNSLFHDFFMDNCNNQNLVQILGTLKRRVFRYHYIAVRYPGNFEIYLKHHDDLFAACKMKDPHLAEQNMKIHLDYTKQVILSELKFTAGVINGF